MQTDKNELGLSTEGISPTNSCERDILMTKDHNIVISPEQKSFTEAFNITTNKLKNVNMLNSETKRKPIKIFIGGVPPNMNST